MQATTINHEGYRPSVLATLRGCIPNRDSITFSEALRVAELQAARLLELVGVTDFPVPVETISELPRIRIEYIDGLPTSGMSFWDGQHWIIQIATDQPRARQRFTLFHEYKHIIDHGRTERLYRGNHHHTPSEQAERAADFFAGCVLMPRRAIKRAWGQLIQRPAALAHHFGTSIRAVEVRLDQTGIREPLDRCIPPVTRRWQSEYRRYAQPARTGL